MITVNIRKQGGAAIMTIPADVLKILDVGVGSTLKLILNLVSGGREMKGRHRFVVITPKEINALGIAMTVPVTSGGEFSRNMGLAVPIMGHDTTGVAVCNQVRSFDIEARVKSGSARYIETLDAVIIDDILNRVISVIECAED